MATLPMQKIMSIINQVAFPALARMQDDMPRLRSRVLLACSLLTVLSVPLLWGMSAVASEIVPLLLGQHWQPAILPLQAITLVVPLRMISTMVNTTVTSLGHSAVVLKNTILTVVVWPTGFLIGAQWGSDGLAMAWLVVAPLTFLLSFPSNQRVIGITWRELARSVHIPLMAGFLMYVTTLIFRTSLVSVDPLPRLVLLIAAGAVVYVGFICLFGRGVIRDLKSLAHAMRSK